MRVDGASELSEGGGGVGGTKEDGLVLVHTSVDEEKRRWRRWRSSLSESYHVRGNKVVAEARARAPGSHVDSLGSGVASRRNDEGEPRLTVLKGDDASTLPEGVAVILLEEVHEGPADLVGRPARRVGERGRRHGSVVDAAGGGREN